ncbi:hypothetical protein [Microbacterium sp. NPDC087589]|uniref:hypothetical protein n=1 Tax=Microbacterium sp. NPDC087589 TaxID=3364191 RepID=UPI00380FE320
MSALIAEVGSGRRLRLEEVDHAPGSVFLTMLTEAGRESGCFEFAKSELLEALRETFGLVDPLEALFVEPGVERRIRA